MAHSLGLGLLLLGLVVMLSPDGSEAKGLRMRVSKSHGLGLSKPPLLLFQASFAFEKHNIPINAALFGFFSIFCFAF